MTDSIRISSRLSNVKPSATLAVSARVAELAVRGIDVIGFGAGEPDFDTPAHIKDAVCKAMAQGGVGKYAPVPGIPSLRTAVAETLSQVHGHSITSDQVVVSCGAKHSLFNVFMATLDPGDEVVIPAPYWVSYPEMVNIAGATPVIVETAAADGFCPEPEAIRAALSPRTRMLVINSPSNPTGMLYDRARLEAIASIAIEHDLYIVSDDIYRSLVYGETTYTSIASLSPEVARRTILVDGVSKSYAMTGWRIGFTAGPVALAKAMSTIQGQSTSGATHAAQVAAQAALTGPQDCVDEMRQSFDERRKAMVARLRDIPDVSCLEPEGAFYCFPDLSAYLGRSTADGHTVATDLDLASYLVDVGQVAIVPGSGFGAPGHARLSYACSMDDIERGVSRMARALGNLVR